MDQPVRRRADHRMLPSVRIPVPGSIRSTYEVRMPRAIATHRGDGWAFGYLDRVTVAHRKDLSSAMRSAWIIGAQRPREVLL